MSKKFKIGSVVRLNSGGPDMTIESYKKEKGQQAVCVHFVYEQGKGNVLITSYFPLKCLTLISDSPTVKITANKLTVVSDNLTINNKITDKVVTDNFDSEDQECTTMKKG